MLYMLRMLAGVALVASCVLGLVGAPEQSKIPLIALSVVIGWAGLKRIEVI